MQFYWTPQAEHVAADAPLTPRTRLGRWLTLSTATHVGAAAVVAWLSISLIPPRPDERLLVRTIDFVEPAPARPAASGGRTREPAAGPPAAAAPRPSPAPRATPAARPSAPPREARAPAAAPVAPTPPAAPTSPPAAAPPAPASAPEPVRTSEVGDIPAPSAEDARLAAATPKAVGGAAPRGPAPISVSGRESAAAPSAAPAVVAGIESGDAPRATVSLPPGLVQGAGGGGGPSGTGAQSAGAGAGRGGSGAAVGGAGGTGVDPGDPDFSEYFRLIERRVRATWTFPESLGGTTQTVKIGFALAPEGSLRDARVISSSSPTLNESALSAMRRAAPFPPLPAKFRALAGQPLVLSFTVTIR
jgi:TonB family protein